MLRLTLWSLWHMFQIHYLEHYLHIFALFHHTFKNLALSRLIIKREPEISKQRFPHGSSLKLFQMAVYVLNLWNHRRKIVLSQDFTTSSQISKRRRFTVFELSLLLESGLKVSHLFRVELWRQCVSFFTETKRRNSPFLQIYKTLGFKLEGKVKISVTAQNLQWWKK